jgi:hypothetical protein
MRIFLSYPKSGRTWARFMLNSYLCRLFELDCANVFEAEDRLKQQLHVEWTHLTGAMVMRRHYWEMGPINLGNTSGGPWVLLTRNFRATLASAYFQARDRVRVFKGTPKQFIRDTRYGVIKLVAFYNLWEQIRPGLPRCAIISYESMLRDTQEQFEAILRALDIEIRDALVSRVIAESTFDHMKALSVTPAYRNTVLAPIDPDRPETFKVRQGGSDTDSLFDDEDIAYIDAAVDHLFLAKDDPVYADCLGEPVRRPTPAARAAAG